MKLTDEELSSITYHCVDCRDDGEDQPEDWWRAAVESLVAKRVRDALREAADAVSTGIESPYLHWKERASLSDWLRDRAAAIETEADDGGDGDV